MHVCIPKRPNSASLMSRKKACFEPSSRPRIQLLEEQRIQKMFLASTVAAPRCFMPSAERHHAFSVNVSMRTFLTLRRLRRKQQREGVPFLKACEDGLDSSLLRPPTPPGTHIPTPCSFSLSHATACALFSSLLQRHQRRAKYTYPPSFPFSHSSTRCYQQPCPWSPISSRGDSVLTCDFRKNA
jgi:hypothetical protein